MSVLLVVSIAVRLAAFAWCLALLRRVRGWMPACLAIMLGLLLTRQVLTLVQDFDGFALVLSGRLDELPDLAISLFAFLAVLTVRHAVDRRDHDASDARQREALLSSIVDTTIDGIVSIDPRGVIGHVNRATEQMFGYTADELVGKNVSVLAASPDRERHDDYLRRYLDTGEARIIGIGREVYGRRKDGSTFPLSLGVGERADGTGFTGVLRDMSERRRLEGEFLRAQKMEAVGRLAGGIAHDFNNLLMGIESCCRIAQRDLTPGGEAARQVREIQDAAGRGTRLTRQLLSMGRLAPIAPTPTRLDAVLASMETMLRSLLGEDVELELGLEAGDASVLADAGQIEQVVLNLAVNARDAMPRGGSLSIASRTLTRAGGARRVRMTVGDSGVGMDETTLANAFEPYFTTKDDAKGTGLGLATVYGIVARLDGTIELESAVGEGTRVTIELPRVEPPPAAEAVEAGALPTGSGETILVVEDDRLVRAGVRHQLEQAGYRVLLAGNGHEALRVVDDDEVDVDLVLTDIVMPGMGGGELVAALAERQPDVRALFMSALPDDVLVAEGRLPAGESALQKPFDEATLATAVRAALDG